MDPFALIMAGLVLGLLLWILFLGVYHPKSGADVLRWEPTRSPELEIQNEIDDMEQMLEATNQRRRARGETDLTEEEMQSRVRNDLRAAHERRERYLEAAEVEQMLAAANERRRARGEPEVTEEEYRARVDAERAEFGGPPAQGD